MSEQQIKAVQYGVGVAGSRIVRLLGAKGVRVVGAIDIDPQKVGKDAGEVAGVAPLGVNVRADPEILFRDKIADVVLHATSYDPAGIVAQVTPALRAGISVVSISGISFLSQQFPDLAAELDGVAREGNATIVGTGLNPGLLQDVLPIVLSGACEEITKITGVRVTDFSPWGPGVMHHCGIGLSEEDFRQGVTDGSIPLHAEIGQSMGMIARALGWELEDISHERTPFVTDTDRTAPYITVKKGSVCGFRHRAWGVCGGETAIELELCGIIHPDPTRDGVEVGTAVTIDGTPEISVVIQGDLGQAEGVYAATAARAVNAVPHVLRAPPGLIALTDLPVIGWWSGRV
jgi:4-hydroxy-tetrahydrodipicolinate reductase